MNTNKQRNSKARTYIKGLLSALIVAVIYNFIWKGYIVHPTPSDALGEKKGKQAILTEIDRKKYLGIVKLEDGFHAYALSDGFWGWSTTDDFYLPNYLFYKDKFVAKKETFKFKGGKDVDIVFVLTVDDQISYFNAYDEKEREIIFDTTRDAGRELHYAFSLTPLEGNLTYEAYSSDDELLYRE